MKKRDPDAPHKPNFVEGFNWSFSPQIASPAAMHRPRPQQPQHTRQQVQKALEQVVREARERRAMEVTEPLNP